MPTVEQSVSPSLPRSCSGRPGISALRWLFFLSRGSTSTGTALHHASWRGQPEVIHLLCAARACVRVVDERGRTALHAAAGEGEGAACVALLSHGAQCEAECVLEATPLLEAVEQGHAACAAALLQHGARADELDLLSLAALRALVGPDGQAAVNSAPAVGSPDEHAMLAGLPLEFAEQATRMAPVLRRLLVANAPPSQASARAVLRASGLPLDDQTAAWRDLARPSSELLMRAPALDAAACAALRAATDEACVTEGGAASEDSVDGLREYQLNLTSSQLGAIVGASALRELTVELPARFLTVSAAPGAPPPAPLRPYQIFARRYSATTRPWLSRLLTVASTLYSLRRKRP